MSYLINVWTTRKCNMECAYCCEDENDFNLKLGESLTLETANDILEFIYTSIDEADFPLQINFHGGEPLLNSKVIEFILDSLLKKNVDFISSITTNGTMLKKKNIRKILDKIDFVSVSLDGEKSSYMKNRNFITEHETYEEVLEQCIKLNNSHRNNIRVRMTVDTNTVEYLHNNIVFLTELSFKEIVAIPNFYSNKWTDKKIECLLAEIDKIRVYYNKLDDEYRMNLLQRKYLRKSACTSGCGYLNIDVDGTFYSCTALLGDKNHIIGDVKNGIKIEKVTEIQKINETEITECRNCVLYEYCTSVRCKLVNKAITGSYNKPVPLNCILQKKMCDI